MSITAALFLRMEECYGNRWITQYAEHPEMARRSLNAWSTRLQGLTSQQISLAAHEMVTCYPSYPPTLGEFLALATGRGPGAAFDPESARRARHVLVPMPRRELTPEQVMRIEAMLAKCKADMRAAAEAERRANDDLGF